jgi:hypothetical protein
MQYVEYDSFAISLKSLYAKGGPFKKAADDVLAMRQKVKDGYKFSEIFTTSLTHHGESRIPHCRKYDLPGRARLVTVVNNNICMFLFAGDHTLVDEWLDKNRNIDFIAKKQGASCVIEPVFISASATVLGMVQTKINLAAPEFLLDGLPARYQEKLFSGLDDGLVSLFCKTSSLADDDEVLTLVEVISNENQKIAILDALLALRDCDEVGAKNRIDLYCGEVKEIAKLRTEETEALKSGERVVFVQDVDQQLFEHFVRTADFQKWMLYLHPSQREYVTSEYKGPARIAGVSGSGKTCVLIHRALRLAEKYPTEKILVLTLNASLATLIEGLVESARGYQRPSNLEVRSLWQLCQEKLIKFEPDNTKLYGQKTVSTNQFSTSEHIEDIWDDYYHSNNNNEKAKILWPLHQSLLARGIFPQDYLKQEFDYVRSAVAPWERDLYIGMERSGRVVPLDKMFRKQVLEGLDGWEHLMNFVGAVDATGIATALYKHLSSITPEYRCILVDEVQDFGTLELSVIRSLVPEAENDIFLCGDAAQSVYTKFQDFSAARINLTGRHMRLNQNYRNSRQILAAAHDVLTRNFNKSSKDFVDLDILAPELANFSTSCPLLLSAGSLLEELSFALGYCDEALQGDSRAKICISIAGYGQRGIEELGQRLSLPVLTGGTSLHEGQIFLSDLEQTKGFEFDRMIVLNCRSQAIPHPDLPKEECFRDLSRLYVAMTRAKTELVMSYHGKVSEFIDSTSDYFVAAEWGDYSAPRYLEFVDLPAQSTHAKKKSTEFNVTGHTFLRMSEAVGLPANAQLKILERVTGEVVFTNINKSSKQKSWRHLDEFLNDMVRPINRSSVYLSDEAWQSIVKQIPSAANRN